MTMLGGKPSKKRNSTKSTLKNELLCQKKEEYEKLSPQEREEISKQMENKYKDSIEQLFKGVPTQLGI